MADKALGDSFQQGGEAYDMHRPGFPAEAVAWLLPSGPRRVVDLGAGTGKLTESLVDRADTVTAVDPSRSMLDQLRRKFPGVRALVGSAEAIPLPDSCADAVVVAQAFHWFDRERAAAEIARVLVPGGRLGLAWNSRDGSQDWEAQATEVFHPGLTEAVGEPFAQLPGFDPAIEIVIPWTETITRDEYIARWRTVSSYLAASAGRRTDMIGRVEQILDADPETAARTSFTLRQQNYCVRMTRSARS